MPLTLTRAWRVEGVYHIFAALWTARRLGGVRKYIACEPSSKTFAGLEEGNQTQFQQRRVMNSLVIHLNAYVFNETRSDIAASRLKPFSNIYNLIFTDFIPDISLDPSGDERLAVTAGGRASPLWQ